MAGLQAAIGTQFAHYWCRKTRYGQHVDVSIQEAVLVTLYPTQEMWYDSRVIQRRYGGKVLRGEKLLRQLIWKCKDGYILWMMMTGRMSSRLYALIKWMDEENMGDGLNSVDFENIDIASVPNSQMDDWENTFSQFFLSKTKRELYDEANDRGIMLFPVNTVEDIMDYPQFADRGFWVQIEHPELRTSLTYPGTPAKIDGFAYSPRRAPLIGEHNEEIYLKELGLSPRDLASLKKQSVI
jgi:crotonobetainyl-CoA:carnitine CoA-transferase CaiB-like acyl-CoA transferase